MKILFCIFLYLGCSCFTQAQTYNSSCNTLPALAATYHNDACKLAIKRLHDIGSALADSIEIPVITIDSIEHALYAVDQMQNASVDDTIRQFFGYTNFSAGSDSSHIVSTSSDFYGAYGIKTIRVVVDNQSDWGQQWLSGNYGNTSNATLNHLINTYQLTAAPNGFQIYPNKTVYLVTAPRAINARALAQQFEALAAVGSGGAYEVNDLPASNGQIIEAMFTGSAIQFTYHYGCGDCPSGCTFGRRWQLLVHANCSVTYQKVENWGTPALWLQNACIDYTQTATLCNVGDSTTFQASANNLDSLQWQVSTNGTPYRNLSNGVNYAGVNTPALKITSIPSGWYGNLYRCLINGTSNKVFYQIKFVNYWTGSTSNAWEEPSNWSCGVVPDGNTDVVIPAGQVMLNTDTVVRSLSVANNAIFTVSPGKHLSVAH